MEILYIAMDSEIDRISFMDEWLGQTNCKFSRVPGVNVVDNNLPFYDRERRLALYGFDLMHSEIGCFLAHRECWKAIVEKDVCNLILESDATPVVEESDWLQKLLSELNHHQQKFDIARLHGIFQKNELIDRLVCDLNKGLKLVQTLGDPKGAGAYVVSPPAAHRLLELTESIWCPVDVFLSQTWRHRLRFRTVKPYPFRVADFPSVIGEDRRRPRQSLLARLQIEKNRFTNDLRRLGYMPMHFFR